MTRSEQPFGGDGATPADGRGRGRGRQLAAVTTPSTPVPALPTRLEQVPDDLIAELVDRFALADRSGAVARIRELRDQGYADGLLRELLAAAVQHVGSLWEHGRWTISQEHAATAVAEAVLTDLEGFDGPADPLGVVAVVAADGEWHALPARLAAHALERAGLEVRYLGAGVPADDIARTLPSLGVDVLAVSVTMASNLPGAARTVAAGHAAGLPVLVGGAAVDAARARSLGADGHATTVEEGAELARRWCAERPTAGPTPVLRDATVSALRADRGTLRDAAFARTARGWPPLEDADDALLDRVTEDLELHLDHLVAALALGDPRIYLDQIAWFGTLHAGRRLPRAVLTAQLDALAEVTDGYPALAPLLASALELAAARR